MYLNDKKINELFDKFCTTYGSNKIMTRTGFRSAIHSITDQSNMLEDPDYVSLPHLRNGLSIAAHVSSLITMSKNGDISDEGFITDMHEASEDFKKSIKDLAKNK